jgi:hypothetical protein
MNDTLCLDKALAQPSLLRSNYIQSPALNATPKTSKLNAKAPPVKRFSQAKNAVLADHLRLQQIVACSIQTVRPGVAWIYRAS